MDDPEMPQDTFLRKVERATNGFIVPPPHHVWPVPPSHLPAAKFIFVRNDAVFPTLAPQRLQIGSEQDSVSVDCLKPAFSDDPTSTTSRPWGRRRPLCRPMVLSSNPPPSSAKNSRRHKRVRFKVGSQVPPPPVPVRQNPYRSTRDKRICSGFLTVPSGGGGTTVAVLNVVLYPLKS